MPKAMFLYDGERLVDRAVRIALDGGCEHVLTVLGASVVEVPNATVIENPAWDSGLSSSLAAGLDHLAGLDSADRVIITLVDEPNIAPADIQQLLTSSSRLAATLYGNQWSHPVLIHSSHWSSLRQALAGDHGARPYLMEHRDELALYQTHNPTGLDDLDYQPTVPLTDRATMRSKRTLGGSGRPT